MVAAHLARSGVSSTQTAEEVRAYLASVGLPAGSVVTVTDERGATIAQHKEPGRLIDETVDASVTISGRPWTVRVGLVTTGAWSRTRPIYQRAILLSGGATLLVILLEGIFMRRWLRALTK